MNVRVGSRSFVGVVAIALILGVAPHASASGIATKISQGDLHGCAITPKARLECWGSNAYGQLGIGNDLREHHTPILVPGLFHVKQVSAEGLDTCAVLKGGAVECWGWNRFGEVGDGTKHQRLVPTPVTGLSSGVKSVSVGVNHSCAVLTSGRIKCWGDNTYGQVGDGTTGDIRRSPVSVPGIHDATQVSAGRFYSCADVAGAAECWGHNVEGVLGDGTTMDRPSPTSVVGLTSGVSSVIAGSYVSCALIGAGDLQCWGDNSSGEIGTGSPTLEYHTPVQVTGMDSGVTSFDSASIFTCAVQNGAAKCWGDNQFYELGTGDADPRDLPTQVKGLTTGVARVDVGGFTGCALLDTGVEKCWGFNDHGETGTGSTSYQLPSPAKVAL